MIYLGDKEVIAVYIGDKEITLVFSNDKEILGSTALIVFSNGYWIDEFPWEDNTYWMD